MPLRCCGWQRCWGDRGRDRLGLALKAVSTGGIAHDFRREQLESDLALEPCVLCQIHLAHAALAERGDDPVVRECLADQEGSLSVVVHLPQLLPTLTSDDNSRTPPMDAVLPWSRVVSSCRQLALPKPWLKHWLKHAVAHGRSSPTTQASSVAASDDWRRRCRRSSQSSRRSRTGLR